MHAEAIRQHEADDDDLLMPVLMALALHAGLIALLILAGWWQPTPERVSVAGPVVQAALVISEADVVQAQQAVEEAPKPAPPEPVEAAPPPQPLPAPQPQDAPEEIQPVPQEQIPEPETIDQEAVAQLAIAEEQARQREIQEEKIRQQQVDLTDRIRQQQAEERQQRRAQELADLRREREEATRRRKIEEARLEQLADAQAARRQPEPSPAETPAQSGNNGEDTDLLARYALAMNQAARAAWNTSLAPEATPCKVSFTQIPGGEVIDVRFLSCPFDGPARESVERALRRDPMPYAGFEPVFKRQVDLTFCHPTEACTR